MSETERHAPGWPGIPPRWTSSAKSGVGTALNLHSRVWFTTSHGILNEVYYPRVDQACTRDMGFLQHDVSVEIGQHFFFDPTPPLQLGVGQPVRRDARFQGSILEAATALFFGKVPFPIRDQKAL